MTIRFLLARRLVPLCLAAALLGTGRPAQAATAAALALDACGAFSREPGLGDPWPGAKAVRLGETVLPGDKGLGCRFTLTGEPAGGTAVVEVRLSRPAAGGDLALDRCFVPVRRGEAAVAVYAFAPGQPVAAGPWTLTLVADGVSPVTARFATPVPQGGPAPLVQAAGQPAPAPIAAPLPPPAPTVPETPAPAPIADPAAGPDVSPGPPGAPASSVDPVGPSAPSPEPAAAAPPPPAPPAPSAQAVPTVPAKPAAATPARPAAGAAKPTAPTPARPTNPAVPAAAKPLHPAAPAGYVALQTGLFADADNAAAQAVRLRSRGLPACVAVAGDGAKRRYRVLAGRFGDRRAAGEARAAVSAILGLSPIVYDVDAAEVARLRCR